MSNDLPLFKDVAVNEARAEERAPRIAEPQRQQVRFECAQDLIPPSHPARVLWDVAGTLDLSAFSKDCGAVEGKAGRSLKSPRMLLTLWMYAISEAIGSAREIERLTKSDNAFRWIVGDLEVSHHRLSKFRVGHREAFSELVTDILGTLMEKGLLSLELVAQDGTRVRAAATAPSFRSYGSLLECREQAALHLKAVLAAAEDPEYTRAQHIAREAKARDYQKRVEAAIATVTELQKQKKKSDEKPARASTTDAEARVMKMPDGGYRPAYNVQYATAGSELGGPRTVVGVQITNVGSDMSSLSPMVEQIEQRTGQLPKTLLADGGHGNLEDIANVKSKGVDVIVPPSERKKPLEQLKEEGADPNVIAWRERMETEEAKELYRARAGLAELSNAHQKTHHGIEQFLVRGLEKVTCVVLLHALTSNILQHAHKLLS